MIKIFTYLINLIIRSSKCEKKVIYLNNQIESLTKAIGYSITPIKIIVETNGIVEPWRLITDCEIADLKYNTFTLNDWKIVIKQVYDEINSKYTWTKNVFDCDNVALLFSAVLSYSIYKSGMELQPAFAIAWSNVHAFNLFIDNENKIYVYEPQTNDIMYFDDAIKDKIYDVRKVWFMS